ncbi:MAG: T9SS type A sorting domain-containing protein, partial [Chitinophagales bacterium]|nr:T9SS type A sorting domain-containing protein [Chitinophagales bacterium]
YPIIAGDTVSYVDIIGQPSLVATVYSFNTAVYINLQIQTPTQLTIIDLNGQTILAKTLYHQVEIVDMNYFPKGIYLVTLKEGEKLLTTKVAIE